jgi:pyridoxamine 5'-phosphate oxidase-like protein
LIDRNAAVFLVGDIPQFFLNAYINNLLFKIMTTKLIQAIPGMPKPVTGSEVEKFLIESKLNVQIATIDEKGYPIVQPIWFLYDRDIGKIYSGTRKETRKIENIRRNPDKVYFSIDDDNFPYKGSQR